MLRHNKEFIALAGYNQLQIAPAKGQFNLLANISWFPLMTKAMTALLPFYSP